MQRHFKVRQSGYLALALTFFLFGCATTILEPHDAAPTTLIDVDAIPPVVPKVEPVTSAGNKSPYTVLGATYHVMSDSRGYSERGIASWYGSKFHGRYTSNGEVYSMYGLTAAHRTLPIPSYVRVHNLENNREIIVRVNDRGPFHDNRVIDLSWAAAAKLGFADTGVAPVEITAIDPAQYQIAMAQQTLESPSPQPQLPAPLADLGDNAYLQVAALRDQASLSQLLDKLIPMLNHPIEVLDEKTDLGVIYRVQIGPIEERSELNLMQTMLELGGLQPGFVVYREACTQNC
jgi:peptidoglycan lytic transglycosylase